MSVRETVAVSWVVAKKELVDSVRDRRSLFMGLLLPLVGPIFIGVFFLIIAQNQRDDAPLHLAIRGGAEAPNLVAFFVRNGAEIVDAPLDAEQRVRDGALDLLLNVPDTFAAELTAGRSATIELINDSSNSHAQSTVRRVQRLLSAYGAELGQLRLLARGVDPALAVPIRIDDVDLTTPERSASLVLALLPGFLLMAMFTGGLYAAIDSTAGERERGSLEPLLLSPIERSPLILGKYLVVVGESALGLALSSVGFAAVLRALPLQELGLRVQLGPIELLKIWALSVPLILLVCGIQVLWGVSSRTVKEAQVALSVFMMAIYFMASFASLVAPEPHLWMMGVPSLSQTLLLGGLLRGEPMHWSWNALALLTSVVGAVGTLRMAIWLLGREKIVFGSASNEAR